MLVQNFDAAALRMTIFRNGALLVRGCGGMGITGYLSDRMAHECLSHVGAHVDTK